MTTSVQKNADQAQKLMLLQGISLIHDGIQFIAWSEKMPNELSYDFFMILYHLHLEFSQLKCAFYALTSIENVTVGPATLVF